MTLRGRAGTGSSTAPPEPDAPGSSSRSLLCSGSNETHFSSHPAPQLFVDKDTIVNAVGTSHDIHLLKIDNREDELVTRVNSWCTHLVDKVRELRLAGGASASTMAREERELR